MNISAKTAHKTFMQSLRDDSSLGSFLGKNALVYYGLVAISGSLLLWASAKVLLPFLPVPMTMQPFAVVLISMMCGRRLALATVSLYLFQGAIGLPVFAGGGGSAYMMGPTGGFLIGFLAAASVCGYLSQRGLGKNFLSALIVALIGMTVIYAFGLVWLSNFLGFGEALAAGFYPFVLKDIITAFLVAISLPLMWKFIKKD